MCGGVKIYKLRHCEGLESWKQDPTWLRVVPGLVPCDHLVDLKVGLTDLVGLVVMVGLVTILKDCLESSHFRRQWASSVRQLVGTAHQQETSSKEARMWRCPAPFLSSTAHCIEVYISVNFGNIFQAKFCFVILLSSGEGRFWTIFNWWVKGSKFSCFTYLSLKC